MLAVAIGTGLYWSQVDITRALPAVLAVLAAACPCAFALALPASLAAAHAMLAKHGVIVTRPDALARTHRIDRIVIDKTGTLTEGRPRLVEIEIVDPLVSRSEALAVAAALERGHHHPIAHAFTEFDLGMTIDDAKILVGRASAVASMATTGAWAVPIGHAPMTAMRSCCQCDRRRRPLPRRRSTA